MGKKTDRVYPLAPFQNKKLDHEQRLEKKIYNGNRFNEHINNIKEMIAYFKDKHNKSKKKYKKK